MRPSWTWGVGLGAGALVAAWGLFAPWAFLGLGLLPFLRLPFALGFGLVLARALLFPLPEPPWGAAVEGVFAVRGGFTRAEGHLLWVSHYPPLPDGRYRLRGRIAPPQGRTNPGGFDQRAWLLSRGAKGVLRAESAEPLGPLPDWREGFRERLGAGLSLEAREVVEGLVLGDKGGLETAYPLFQRAGLAHLLALSGLHVGVLVGFAVLGLYPLGRWRYLLALALLPFYLLLAGPSPSLVRASLMAGLSLLGLFLGLGGAGVVQALGLALFLQLLLRPEALLGLGFQLSYLAVLGLALVLPALRLPPGPRGYLLGGVAASLAVQAFLLPLLLHRFGFAPLLAPLANLLPLPLVEPLARGLLLLAGLAAQGPLLRWGEIAPPGFALYYLGLLPLLFALHRRLPWRRALLLASLPTLVGLLAARPKPLDLWMLDVGQGDALLARMGGGEVLVDGGRAEKGEAVVRALRALGVEALELLVATHPDADHYGGLFRVIEEVPVGLALLAPGFPEDHPLAQALRARGVPVVRAGAGTRLKVGQGEVRVLWPEALSGDDNQDGLALLLDFGRGRALLLADLPREVEARLPVGEVEALKVSHHGSQSGTSEVLLERTRPRVALIGVGPNPFGHPHPEVLERLERHGAEVRRTDQDGAVRVLFGYAW